MMGCIESRDDEREAAERSKAIDQKLRSDAEMVAKQVKLLLLGENFKILYLALHFNEFDAVTL